LAAGVALQCRLTSLVMADPPRTENGAHEPPVADLAAEAERGRTPRTPFLALAGVWLAVAAVVMVLLALALTLYFVYGGR
jgi:hypothetical protein